MIFALIYTVLLALSFFILLTTGMGRMIPIGVRILPLITIALLWLHTLLFRLPGRRGGGGTALLVLFYFLAYGLVFLPALGSLVIGFLDRPRSEPQVTFGEGNQKEIVLVYHPGVSGFTPRMLKQLAAELSRQGLKVTLHTARPGLRLEIEDTLALGLSSPVYGGTIRPPLQQFIRHHDLQGRSCFIVLTGQDPDNIEADIEKASATIREKGGRVLEGIKLIQGKEEEENNREINRFAERLAGKL